MPRRDLFFGSRLWGMQSGRAILLCSSHSPRMIPKITCGYNYYIMRGHLKIETTTNHHIILLPVENVLHVLD